MASGQVSQMVLDLTSLRLSHALKTEPTVNFTNLVLDKTMHRLAYQITTKVVFCMTLYVCTKSTSGDI